MSSTMQTSTPGRPGRVFFANFLGGPLLLGLAFSATLIAIGACAAVADKDLSGPKMLPMAGVSLMVGLMLSMGNVVAGLGSAVYAAFSVRKDGRYSIPIAIAVGLATAFVATLSAVLTSTSPNKPSIVIAMLGAALSTATAGWLARRSGSSWR